MGDLREVILAENEFIWNAGWDSSKHPRDKKGRFTFVVKVGDLFSKNSIDGRVLNPKALSKMRAKIQDYSKQSKSKAREVAEETKMSKEYQNLGYKWMNNGLRAGFTTQELGIQALDNSCRFSADEEFQTYRGECSYKNNWKGVKAGSQIPDGLKKAFISTSTDKNVATHFTTSSDDNLYETIYRTSVQFNVPTSQRFGVTNAYNHDAITLAESEILLPCNTSGTVKSFKETTKQVGKQKLVEQVVEIDL